MAQLPLDFREGQQLRDEGIRRALDHADREQPDWSVRAYEFLLAYIQTHAEFQTTDLRLAAHGTVPEPPDARAWGMIVRRAVKEGRLRAGDYRPVSSARAHLRPMPVWLVNRAREGSAPETTRPEARR